MPSNWSKGFTKETHPSILKISQTFRRRKIDNFSAWRERMRKAGIIKSPYPVFKRNGDLAELIGVILGDGNIEAFPRSERLTIAANADAKGFIKRYAKLVKNTFRKEPTLTKMKSNCVRISVYEKYISKRLKIPTGSKGKVWFKIPWWIKNNRSFLIRYLRGLYEAEGSFCVHKPTSTYKFLFCNSNKALLRNVFESMKALGFHPHRSHRQVQISRKREVYASKDLLKFRQY